MWWNLTDNPNGVTSDPTTFLGLVWLDESPAAGETIRIYKESGQKWSDDNYSYWVSCDAFTVIKVMERPAFFRQPNYTAMDAVGLSPIPGVLLVELPSRLAKAMQKTISSLSPAAATAETPAAYKPGTGFKVGDRVRLVRILASSCKEYVSEANRARSAVAFGTTGRVTYVSDSHGTCYSVLFDDGKIAYFDEAELAPA